VIRFEVIGVPQPGGSKSAFPLRHKDGSPVLRENGSQATVVSDANPRVKDWRVAVVAAAREVYRGTLLDGPLSLRVLFRFPRLKGHLGKRGLLPSAPPYPATKPDATKLLRALEDALTGILWRDDAQVVEQWVGKVYGEPAGAIVVVDAAPPGLERFSAQLLAGGGPSSGLVPPAPSRAVVGLEEDLPLFAVAGGPR
jgi:Holliday junction resolvase RusA-like endonuclease